MEREHFSGYPCEIPYTTYTSPIRQQLIRWGAKSFQGFVNGNGRSRRWTESCEELTVTDGVGIEQSSGALGPPMRLSSGASTSCILERQQKKNVLSGTTWRYAWKFYRFIPLAHYHDSKFHIFNQKAILCKLIWNVGIRHSNCVSLRHIGMKLQYVKFQSFDG